MSEKDKPESSESTPKSSSNANEKAKKAPDATSNTAKKTDPAKKTEASTKSAAAKKGEESKAGAKKGEGRGGEKQGGHGAPVDSDQPVNPDYQDKDIHLETVRRFMFGSLGVTLVFFVLMLIVHRIYTGGFVKERGEAAPEERQIPRSDQALLQTDELMDLEEYLAQEDERLNQTSREGEQAVVPLEEAMRMMVEEGYPTPAPRPEGEVARARPAAPPAPPRPKEASTEEAAPQEVLDPEIVEAGKQLFEMNCVVCHSGQPNAIGPDIRHAFGTMRELEDHDPIRMDDWYVRNSMNNPNEHIAKGFQANMTSFKNQLPRSKKDQIIEYLKSEGPNPPPMKGEEPEPAPEPARASASESEPAPAPPRPPEREPRPEPAAEPAPRPSPKPAPQPEPEPEERPAPKRERPAPIFI